VAQVVTVTILALSVAGPLRRPVELMDRRLFVGNTNAGQKGRLLVGLLDDFRFWPHALSTQEMEEIPSQGGPLTPRDAPPGATWRAAQ
jgi:hypothetical protein